MGVACLIERHGVLIMTRGAGAGRPLPRPKPGNSGWLSAPIWRFRRAAMLAMI